jgi:hypothetical protein
MPLSNNRETFGHTHRRANIHKGSGLICDDEVVKKERMNTRPGFSGEKHGYSLCSGARFNYLGPSTNVDARLARGDKPINDLDSFAQEHDIAYNKIAKDVKAKRIDRPEFVARVKKADEIFKEKAVKSKDAPILGKIASKAILAKEIGEDLGVLSRSTFSGGGMIKKPEKEIKPADRLKKKVMQETRKNKKGGVIEIKPDKEKEDQEGGLLGALALSVLSGLATTAIDKLITHFTEDKKGSGMPKTKKEKIKFLAENVPEGLLLKVARRI